MSIIDVLKDFWQHHYHQSLFYQFATTVINEFGRLGCPIGRSGMLTFTEILTTNAATYYCVSFHEEKEEKRKKVFEDMKREILLVESDF